MSGFFAAICWSRAFMAATVPAFCVVATGAAAGIGFAAAAVCAEVFVPVSESVSNCVPLRFFPPAAAVPK